MIDNYDSFTYNLVQYFGELGADIEELTLSTAYDIQTASHDTNDGIRITDQDSSPKGLAFNTDGTKMFVTGDANDKIYEYTLSTGWDVSTASYVDALDVSSQDNDVEGLSFDVYKRQ